MKTANLFKTGRSKAIRLPQTWIEGIDEVFLEKRKDEIVFRRKKRDLWQVAKACDDRVPRLRLPQSQRGIRIDLRNSSNDK